MKINIQKSFSTLILFFTFYSFGMLTERKSWYGRQGRPSDKSAQPDLKKVEFGGELEKALEVVV
jgi:hypothetical protein